MYVYNIWKYPLQNEIHGLLLSPSYFMCCLALFPSLHGMCFLLPHTLLKLSLATLLPAPPSTLFPSFLAPFCSSFCLSKSLVKLPSSPHPAFFLLNCASMTSPSPVARICSPSRSSCCGPTFEPESTALLSSALS